MIEPPTKQLLDTLHQLGIATQSDLRRCRPHVRRVARDLPAFDSVWIDALVRARKLTLFQGRTLESSDPAALRVGPCVLIDRLGRHGRSETYLARRLEGRQRCVLKLIARPPESRDADLSALKELVAKSRERPHPSYVAPEAALRHRERLVTVSRFVPGLHLGEMLVRRGRFEPGHVMEMARQLVDGLAAAEECGCVHGEIALWNVRLTAGGRAVLVDTGISPAIAPELTIHAARPAERYDYVAPELIGTGRHPDPCSDRYALGCLLWHLLAGRPPYPTADPLGKLAAHQTRTIDDVRQWAPDTPEVLAQAVGGLTARDPRERLASFGELQEQLGSPGRFGRRRLARLQASFNAAAPRVPSAPAGSSPGRWPGLLIALFVLSGLALSLAGRETLSDPLSLPRRVSEYVESAVGNLLAEGSEPALESAKSFGGPHDDRHLLPLPAPNSQGEIILDSAGPYAWRRVDAVGPITLRGGEGLKPVVVVSAAPCRVVAETVNVENVHFRLERRSAAVGEQPPPAALLLVQSQDLTLRQCSFWESGGQSGDTGDSGGRRRPVAVAWTMLDTHDASGGRVSIENTVFSASAAGVSLSAPPQLLECVNSLKLGPGPMLVLHALPAAGRMLRVSLDRLTLRRADSLLKVHLPPAQDDGPAAPLLLEAVDCVFNVVGPNAALYQFVSSDGRPLTPRIEMTGKGSIVPPQLTVAVRLDPATGETSLVDPLSFPVEGIAAGRYRFKGPASRKPADSEIESFQGPRVISPGNTVPGIDSSMLVVPGRTASPSPRVVHHH